MNRHAAAGRSALLAALALSGLLTLEGCGQKGALYLPGEAREIVTRPTQTPPAEPAPPPPVDAPNSPDTVDSPVGPASPAPEVVAPETGAPDTEDHDKKSAPKP